MIGEIWSVQVALVRLCAELRTHAYSRGTPLLSWWRAPGTLNPLNGIRLKKVTSLVLVQV